MKRSEDMDRLAVYAAVVVVGEACGALASEILSKSRRRHLVDMRTVVVCHLLGLGWTVNRIARGMGCSHATVVHHRQRSSDLCATCPGYRRMYGEAMGALDRMIGVDGRRTLR